MPPPEAGDSPAHSRVPAGGIDERASQLGAAITAALLLATVWFALIALFTPPEPASFGWFAYQPLAGTVFVPGSSIDANSTLGLVVARASDPAFICMSIATALFLWGAISPRTHPANLLFERAIAPRLGPAHDVHPFAPVRFGQRAGLVVTALGMLLHLVGIPYALLIAAIIAFVASFLRAVFSVCVACQLALLLARLGLRGRCPRAVR